MSGRLLRLGLAWAAGLLVISVCLRINPAALDWRRARLPILETAEPPTVSPIGFKSDRARTWDPPETFSYYRGSPTRDGVYREGPLTPPLKIDWTTESFNVGVHGASKSSPAVDASGIYIGADSGWIRAYAHDGTLRWAFRIANAVRGIHSTPILTKHRVYIGSYGGTFYVLDKSDGRLLWTFHEERVAFGSSPFVIDDHLIAAIETETLNAFVVALDPEDGTTVWRSPFLGEQIHSSPAYDRATNTVLIGTNAKTLISLNAADGQIVWRRFLGGEIKGTPLVEDGVVYVTSWAAKLHAVDVRDGHLLWEAPLAGASQSSPTLIPGSDTLIVGSSTGAIHGVDRRTGRALWSIKGDERVLSSALAAQTAGGKWLGWIACGGNGLCALDPRDGRVVQRISLAGRLTGVPVAFGSSLFVSLDFPGGLVKLSGNRH